MKKVLLALAPGFEEIETIAVADILRRAGARVTLAGTVDGAIEGSRGVRLLADARIESANADEFDMIVLPGGQPGTNNLLQNEHVAAILTKMHASGKMIAAICAAPTVLHHHGILRGRKATCHPSVREKIGDVSDERVVVDGQIITSQAPGTALEFAFKLVEMLFGGDRVNVVNQGVLARI
jgi:4-methyl-5(b-hydroxyethyl)-thiazole monophosphate biosynthesis